MMIYGGDQKEDDQKEIRVIEKRLMLFELSTY